MLIETQRLILRKWQDSDLIDFACINSSSKVCQFLPKILSHEESDLLALKIKKHFEEYGFGLFAAELKENGKFIGFIGLNKVDFALAFSDPKKPAIEISWRLDENCWNQGLATEGAKAVLDFAFNKLKLTEIISFTFHKNMSSRKVMEKIGMKYDKNGDFSHPKLGIIKKMGG